MNWTRSTLEKLKREGKIKGYHISESGEKVKNISKRSKEKDWIEWNLTIWCKEKGYELQREYRFHGVRKWRADWAIPELKILIEYEGLMSEKSGHTTIKGYSKDTEKYREAAKLGWMVLRYTAINYKKLINDLNETERFAPLRSGGFKPLY